MSVQHYENFPVASWLCPPALRPPVRALYHFARTADDLADEGEATTEQRLCAIRSYRDELRRCLAGHEPQAGTRWADIFEALSQAVATHRLPTAHLYALLDAFEQDIHNPCYVDRAQLLEYCARSAQPVGRLILHLHGVQDARSRAQSDAVCTALQLINFWQDLSVDLPRGRVYLPQSDAFRHGLRDVHWPEATDTPQTQALVRELCGWAEELMYQGAPLALALPGRIGWELRLVVQGGLRVLHRIARMNYRTMRSRPRLGPADAMPLVWNALFMRAPAGT